MHPPAPAPPAPLQGRDRETTELERLLASTRDGGGGALVVRGEPGIGKTALLLHARASGAGFQVIQVAGVETEIELPFAALHQLCAPLLGQRVALAATLRDELEAAFGLRDDVAPSVLRVGVAVLTLLGEASADGPVLVLIDDAQWLDQASAQVLGFVARRLERESVAMVLAVRDPHHVAELDGLPVLAVSALSDDDARALLTAAVGAPLDQPVRDRVVAEARGNPLALLELPRTTGPLQLAGGFAPPDRAAVAQRLETSFRDRLAALPSQTRLLLLVAAAEPVGDPAMLWRAAGELGVAPDAAAPAEAAALVEIATRVRFAHPLVRSVVYWAAPLEERRRAHGALAAATDADNDPDRRAWHAAQAADGPDATVADALEASAGRAQQRGGMAATAAFLQRSAELTLDPDQRATRLLRAVTVKLEAGDPVGAQALLTAVQAGGLTELQRAQSETLAGHVAFSLQRAEEAPAWLLRAAARLAPLDPALSRATYLDAIVTGIVTADVDTVLAEARKAPPPAEPRSIVDDLLDGMVATLGGEREAGARMLQRAVAQADDPAWEPRLPLSSLITMRLWDIDASDRLTRRGLAQARAAGALIAQQNALTMVGGIDAHAGRLAAARADLGEAEHLAAVTGTAPLDYLRVGLASIRGRLPDDREILDGLRRGATARGEHLLAAEVDRGAAMVANASGRTAEALEAAQRACAAEPFSSLGLVLFELVEAATRCGETATAADALRRLRERTQVSGTDWALGVEACAAAVAAADEDAEPLYEEALTRLTHPLLGFSRARALLLYGEWLRRSGRRRDARAQLAAAHELFDTMGAEGFAARAAREMSATGQRVRRHSRNPLDDLTAQELHIARLVATGATSKEVAAEVFVSPRTVDAHLRSIFAKLGLTSRRELRRLDFPEPVAPR